MEGIKRYKVRGMPITSGNESLVRYISIVILIFDRQTSSYCQARTRNTKMPFSFSIILLTTIIGIAVLGPVSASNLPDELIRWLASS